MPGWNPWHGCHKISPGCANCYVYRMDAKYDRISSDVVKTASFDLPVRKDRHGEYKIRSGESVGVCFTSDFFVEEADEWRKDAWSFMRERSDLHFFFITKRIARFNVSLPDDWGDGYDNVAIGCTVENMNMARERLPLFLSAPIKHRVIAVEPMLEQMDISPYLGDGIEAVVAGGESGKNARSCNFDWFKELSRQCAEAGVGFEFHQTGARLIVDNRVFCIDRKFQHSQAKKAGIDVIRRNSRL